MKCLMSGKKMHEKQENYIPKELVYYSEGDIKKAYECYDKLFTLYTASPNVSPDVYMCNSRQLFRYTAQLDDKTVTDLANYGKQQEYRNKGYYNDVVKDEPDVCE